MMLLVSLLLTFDDDTDDDHHHHICVCVHARARECVCERVCLIVKLYLHVCDFPETLCILMYITVCMPMFRFWNLLERVL